jgi:hypothetical protein
VAFGRKFSVNRARSYVYFRDPAADTGDNVAVFPKGYDTDHLSEFKPAIL